MEISLIVICSTRLTRDGIRSLIDSHPTLRLVGMANNCSEASTLLQDRQAEVALLEMASTSSFESLRALTSRTPRIKVVAFALPDVEDIILEYAEAGVIGFVNRDATLEETVKIIQAAVRNELLCSKRTAAALLRRITALANRKHADDAMKSLTPRELVLLELIEQGMSNKDIARKLRIELSTVKNHVHNILEKLNVRRRGQAAALMHRRRARAAKLSTTLQSSRESVSMLNIQAGARARD